MMTGPCPLCGHDSDALNFIAEQYLLAEIAKEHPEWSIDEGICPKCMAYYRGLSDAVAVVAAEPDDLDLD